MTASLSLCLRGADVLCDGSLRNGTVAINAGRIAPSAAQIVDLSGFLILPGIIDLHGDAFERHIAPRPSAPFPISAGLAATDRDLAANGVTTAWLAQSWSWEGGARGPDFAEALMLDMETYAPRALTDMRLQLRVETHTVDTEARLLAAIRRHGIGYVIFNNHLDEAMMLARTRPEEILLWAKKAGRSSQQHMDIVRGARDQKQAVPRYLCHLAAAFDQLGVRYGSHDDPDGATRETYSLMGARICEFPTATTAAASARAVGDPVLMGAPNVARGGSQSGNIAATDLIRAGLCDALVSDYHYPALALAAFRLVDDGLMDMAPAWAMISTRPAAIMGLSDRGRIAEGLRADLVVLNPETRQIEATICAGRIAYLSGEAGNRFVQAMSDLAVAAE